jgi:hypothetical protein
LLAAAYQMSIQPAPSGLTASVDFTANTAGTLIGAYDPNVDPNNTRTKPGAFGAFGATENLPVQLTLDAGLGGDLNTAPTGSFTLTLNPGGGTLTIADFSADLLGGSSAALTATITLATETFRTRNPTSLFPGGIPITVPIGEATLSQLVATQGLAPGAGTLTPAGPGQYDFNAVVPVTLQSSFELFGNPLTPPPTPAVLPLAGQITVSGQTAALNSVQPIELVQSVDPNQSLPALPLALPTLLPPGGTANVVLSLTLATISADISGTNALVAAGPADASPGDLDCDGDVDFDDIDPFVLALGGQTAYELIYPDCNWLNADCNGDATVDVDDVDAFVALLGG